MLLFVSVLFASCATTNGRLGDEKKRRPLYNSKYILQAKKNAISSRYTDDKFLVATNEEENIPLKNREMYRKMVREDRLKIAECKRKKEQVRRYATHTHKTRAWHHCSPSCRKHHHSLDGATMACNCKKRYVKTAPTYVNRPQAPAANTCVKNDKKVVLLPQRQNNNIRITSVAS